MCRYDASDVTMSVMSGDVTGGWCAADYLGPVGCICRRAPTAWGSAIPSGDMEQISNHIGSAFLPLWIYVSRVVLMNEFYGFWGRRRPLLSTALTLNNPRSSTWAFQESPPPPQLASGPHLSTIAAPPPTAVSLPFSHQRHRLPTLLRPSSAGRSSMSSCQEARADIWGAIVATWCALACAQDVHVVPCSISIDSLINIVLERINKNLNMRLLIYCVFPCS